MQATTFSPGELKQAAEQAQVSALYYYPIKSCGGTSVEQVEVIERGILHDRELMLVAAETGEFLTQRELRQMALIRPSITGQTLRVEAPGMPAAETELTDTGRPLRVKVWSDRCRSIDQGDEIAGWFSEYLKVDCRLVRMAPDFVRRVDSKYAVSNVSQVGFADGYPFLIASTEGLDDLNRRMEEPLPMNRFRPNIVLSGSGIPFIEDYLKRLVIGEITLDIVKACVRCAITTTDQETAVIGKEPLRTLATFRKSPRGVTFAQNAIHENTGVLRVGDTVKVLELK